MKLVIIRHPETNNIAGLPGEQGAPSPKGLKQLSHISAVCRKEEVEAVVTSTMPRAAIVANELSNELAVPLYSQENLQERDFGDWNKEEWPQISMKLKKLTLEDRYVFEPPNGESWQAMEARLREALKDIAALNKEVVAVMTHAGCIRVIHAILGAMTNKETTKFIPVLGECFVMEFEPKSID